MKLNKKICLLTLLTLTFSKAVIAGPWFTGPILAPPGHTLPNGHTNLEIYGFYTDNKGAYDNNWQATPLSGNNNTIGNAIFTHGLTDFLDFQFVLPYSYNRFNGAHARHIDDVAATLGIQLIEQKESKWRPNLRFAIQQVFPTGRYRELNPLVNGTDATGSGSYQTSFSFNFQHLLQLSEINYLRTRLSLAYTYAANTALNGLSTFGGALDTFGGIQPGNLQTIDLAEELTLTKHWVAVMEAYLAKRQATRFHGNPGTNFDGSPASVGNAALAEITLAPAIEYNFSENAGLLAGPWFSVKGKNTFQFISYVVALNLYW